MSKFTKGKCDYAESVPEGVTINGKEYTIFTGSVNPQDEGDDVALARREADARLIAAAPESGYVFELAKNGVFRLSDEFRSNLLLLMKHIEGDED